MKLYVLLPFINFLVAANCPQIQVSSTSPTDTTNITHLLDGNITEWPEEKFALDKATKIRYAIDNDNQMLFLAINVSDRTTQQRIMQKGMHLFIDLKGKKKESRGVEFPLGMENVSDIGNMKVFGFSNTESAPQNVKTAGNINIAMGWDSAYVLSIEYNIPLKILEASVADLVNKKISIGWKLKESEMAGNTFQTQTVTTTRLVAVPAGTRPPGNRSVSNVNNNPALQSNSNKEQSFWTSHTIIF